MRLINLLIINIMDSSIHSAASFEKQVISSLEKIQNASLTPGLVSREFYNNVLIEVLALTESSYGFIGEVFVEDLAFPYLHVHSVEDLNWNLQARNNFQDKLTKGINFRKPNGLFGIVKLQGVRLIEVVDSSIPELEGWPADCPNVKNMAAFPIMGEKDMVGMLVIANCPHAYKEDLENKIKVIIQMVARHIEHGRHQEQQRFLTKSDEYYHNLIDNMPGAVCRMLLDDDLQILDASHQIESITGYRKDEYLTGNRITYSSKIDEKHRSRVLTTIRDSVEKGCAYDLEYPITDKSGETHWVLDKGYGLYHADGELCYISNYLIDITNQKNLLAQENAINERLLQAQQMQTIGQMAGGVAHDLNNMLASMMGYSELCLEMIEDNEFDKIANYQKQILLAGNRARDVVSSMETFSRGSDSDAQTQSLSISNIFEDLQKVLYVTLPKTVTLKFSDASEMPAIEFDPVGIQQIIVSLCINASTAMDGRGLISFTAEEKVLEGIECASCHEMFSGRYVEICIEDDGSGIPENVISRIFDPFFTTGQMGNGAGMGLPVVHGMIHNYKGHISVNSEEGGGSVFRLYFPVAGLQDAVAW